MGDNPPPPPPMGRSWGIVNSIDVFNGEDGLSVTAFIDLINTVGTMTNLGSAAKCQVARLKLRGSAREFLESDPPLGVTADWPTLSTALLNRFRPRETQHTIAQKFSQAKQKPGESVQNFATRIRRIAHQWNESLGVPLTQQEKETRRRILAISTKDNFCRGLSDSIRRFVLARCPPDLDAAISAAIEESLSAEMDAAAATPVFGVTFSDQGQRPGTSGGGARAAGPGPYSSQDAGHGAGRRGSGGRGRGEARGGPRGNSGPPVGSCNRCGRPGHYAKFCRTPWDRIQQVSNMPGSNYGQGNASRVSHHASRGGFQRY